MAIIAGELDLDVPKIDLSEIEKFLVDTHEIHLNSRTSTEEKIYQQRNDREYPWQRRVLEFKGKSIYDYSEYPELKKFFSFIDTLPVNAINRTSVMLYQTNQKSYDFNWHFDGDTQYGFRVCVGLDKSVPFVQLGKLKPNYEHVTKTFEKIENFMIEENKQYDLYPSKENTVFLLNRLNCPHRVPIIENSKQRCVIIVFGDTFDLNLKYIQRIDDDLHAE